MGWASTHLASAPTCWLCVPEIIFPVLKVLGSSLVKQERLGRVVEKTPSSPVGPSLASPSVTLVLSYPRHHHPHGASETEKLIFPHSISYKLIKY